MRRIHTLIAAAVLLGAAHGSHAQSSLRLVAVQSSASGGRAEGVGILRPRNTGECFVVTPRHVADPSDARTGGVRAVVPGGVDGLVSVAERYSEDIAVWRMARRVDRSNCPDWPSVADVNRTLERAVHRGTKAVVIPWTSQGPGQPVEVTIDQLTLTRFNIYQDGQALQRGMSGSPVQVGGTVVGILTEVESDDRSASYGVVIRLDYVERHFGPFFHPTPSPDDAAIYASVLIPGLGQGRTRRAEAGLFWFGLAVGPSAALFFETRNEQIPRTRTLPDGREETYYETRPSNPRRRYSWVPWLVAGLGSFLEARGHASRYYIPPERSGTEPSRQARLRVRPDVRGARDGGTRIQVAELRI